MLRRKLSAVSEREFLDSFASHYQTGEKIPQQLIDRLTASQQYGAAYACMRQLSFGYLDMAWHTITEPVIDVRVSARSPWRAWPNSWRNVSTS